MPLPPEALRLVVPPEIALTLVRAALALYGGNLLLPLRPPVVCQFFNGVEVGNCEPTRSAKGLAASPNFFLNSLNSSFS